MRIVVNDIAASNGGALSILKSLYEYLKENDKENEWIFLLSGKYLESAGNIKVKIIPKVKRNWICKLNFDYVYGRNVINELKPDYVLSLQNTMTYGVKARQGVYIHQAIPFQSVKKFSFLKKDERIYAVYQYLIGNIIKKAARNADHVFVQTKWMQKAVSKKSQIDREKIIVIPVDRMISERNGIIQKRKSGSFFYPAGFEAIYKNHMCIYKACKLLDAQGIDKYEVLLTLEETKKNVSERILCIGLLDKAALTEQYQKSTVIFPSYIETVGLPLVEAMAEGSIILAADCEYSRDVLKNYENVYYFDPFIPEELAELMKKVINEEIKFSKKEDGIKNYKKKERKMIVEKGWKKLITTITRNRDKGRNEGKNAEK